MPRRVIDASDAIDAAREEAYENDRELLGFVQEVAVDVLSLMERVGRLERIFAPVAVERPALPPPNGEDVLLGEAVFRGRSRR